MSSDACAVRVSSLSKSYTLYDQPSDRLRQFVLPRLQALLGLERRRYYREFWALRDVNLEVRAGETVGLLGRNGAGKSTLLQLIAGTLTATRGRIDVQGRIAALLELGSGFNPDFTGIENVRTYASVLGLPPSEIDARLEAILDFADIGGFVHQPVKTYSSGMLVRLAFAVASSVDADILIVDEALSVGDLAFQNKCLRRIREFIERGGTTLFVSHSPGLVSAFCDRAYWLHGGVVRQEGPAQSVVNDYVNFMRDGFDETQRTPTSSVASDVAGWMPIGSENQVDARAGCLIDAFSLTDASTGRPVSVLSTLPARVTLKVRIRPGERVEQPLLGLGLFGAMNIPVVHFNNAALDTPLPALPAGRTSVIAVSFDLPPISDGDYVLQMGIDDGVPGASVMLCHVHSAATLVVATRRGRAHRQYGLVPVDEASVDIGLEQETGPP